MQTDLRDRAAIGLAGLAVLLLGAAAWLLLAPPAETVGESAVASADSLTAIASASEAALATTLVVDVEGAVTRPGVVSLSPGARVADAIRAAGGYAADADLGAAARDLNLAALLADGAQVYIPILGATTGPGTSDSPTTDAGLVNLNTASATALEALPGIGPVTVDKLLVARAEQPFTSLDELVDRKVMNRGQLDGIRALVTV